MFKKMATFGVKKQMIAGVKKMYLDNRQMYENICYIQGIGYFTKNLP